MNPTAELYRQQNNQSTLATITHVDEANGLCRVQIAENQSDWLPFQSPRMGASKIWLPPSIGEQVELISQGGELSVAIVGASVHSDQNPPPSNPKHIQMHAPDGAEFRYDHENHTLFINLPSGTAQLNIDQINVSGTVTATDFITQNGVSLNGHVHRYTDDGRPMQSQPPSQGSGSGAGNGSGTGGSGSNSPALPANILLVVDSQNQPINNPFDVVGKTQTDSNGQFLIDLAAIGFSEIFNIRLDPIGRHRASISSYDTQHVAGFSTVDLPPMSIGQSAMPSANIDIFYQIRGN